MAVIVNEPKSTPRPKRRGQIAAEGGGEDVPGITRPMTYEEYLAGPEEMRRYDIIDGWKVYRLYGDKFLPAPTLDHQEVALNVAEPLRAYQRQTKCGKIFMAPVDVQITKRPLRCRQPDLLFISTERLEQNEIMPGVAKPLTPAPELVIEVLSPSDTSSVLAAKVADYRSAEVREIWLVRTETRTVELIALSWEEIKPVRTYAVGEIVESRAFRGLAVPVEAIFAE